MTTDLLSAGNDSKTPKGEKIGVYTAIQYLLPANAGGKYNLCAYASNGCLEACLNTAGRGKFNSVQKARLNRTNLFNTDRETFFIKLIFEIARHRRKALKLGLQPAMRLNGTSDIKWEAQHIQRLATPTIFDLFPDVQFYDYTAYPYHKRPTESLPANYHLTMSRKENNEKDCLEALRNGRNVAAVFSTKKGEALPKTYKGYEVIDGDLHDVRYKDKQGVVVGLRAKGDARKDQSGFVIQV